MLVGRGISSLSVRHFRTHLCRPAISAGFTILGGLPGVPEPSTWAMLLLGFVGLGVAGHNHRLYAERAASFEFDRRHKPRAASLFFSSRLSSRIAGSRDLQSCALDIVSH